MIAIYSNTGEWGGVDVLIARFAKYLQTQSVPFCIIEPKNSRLRCDLTWAFFCDPDEVASISDTVTHVFVPTISKLRDKKFPWDAMKTAKVFAWVVHPNDVFRVFFPFSVQSMSIFGYRAVGTLKAAFVNHAVHFNSLFTALARKNALAVMDGATDRSLRFFVSSKLVPVDIIPIASPSLAAQAPSRPVSAELSIGYLGRMDADRKRHV